jgi:hypothetical protein
MKLKPLLLLTLLTSLLTTVALSEEIGRAVINGKAIVVDGNGTWKYADAPLAATTPETADCGTGSTIKSKKLPLSLCIAPPWRLDQSPQGSMEMQAVNGEADLYFGLVTERSPVPLAMLRKAILYNAAQATGVREEDIAVAKEELATINGYEWNYIEYDVNYQGAKFRFSNYYGALADVGNVQAVFWCSPAYFDQNKQLVQKFMSTINLQIPQQ